MAKSVKRELTKLTNHVRDEGGSSTFLGTWWLYKGDQRANVIVAVALLEQAIEYAL